MSHVNIPPNIKQDLRSFLDLIKNYDENDVIISILIGFQRAYKAPNQRYESWSMPHAHASLGIPRLPFLRKSCQEKVFENTL